MAQDLPRVINIPRSDLKDDQSQFVLVHVESAGKQPLDLKLIGTDGESVFSVSLKHNQTSSWKDKKFPGDSEQWDQILFSILLGAEPNEATQAVEAVARVVDGPSLRITIQKRIEQITQKLGVITLDEREEVVELYDWCGLTIKSKDNVAQELKLLRTQLKAREDETKRLKDELEKLTKLKNDHENGLIEKFSLLLNEKKLKIRDQQRLLAGAKLDPAKVEAAERRTQGGSNSVGPSRPGKRRAAKSARDETDSGSDGGFEKMEVDAEQGPPESDEEPPQTPDQESTADEASEDDQPILPPPTRQGAKNAKAAKSSTGKTPSTSTAPVEPEALPPKRELPFARKKSAPTQAPPPQKATAAADGSETESDDDEL